MRRPLKNYFLAHSSLAIGGVAEVWHSHEASLSFIDRVATVGVAGVVAGGILALTVDVCSALRDSRKSKP